jgi:hypothetical protein
VSGGGVARLGGVRLAAAEGAMVVCWTGLDQLWPCCGRRRDVVGAGSLDIPQPYDGKVERLVEAHK